MQEYKKYVDKTGRVRLAVYDGDYVKPDNWNKLTVEQQQELLDDYYGITSKQRELADVNMAAALLKGLHRQGLIGDKTLKACLADAQKRVDLLNENSIIESNNRRNIKDSR